MATKTPKTAAPAKSAPRAAKPAKTAPVKKPGRGPRARLLELHGSKEKLVDKLAPGLVGDGEDEGALKERLGKASNQQLLRLAGVVDAVTKAYGSKDKLVAALAKALGKAKDKDYLARLGSFSLPKLYDLARSNERRTKAAAKKA
ncbi:MAG TPA: hypothetical protein VHE35_08585 [Kofleriaceae bacterium]|nr:hypothetical protein [Kofleriaceae bacterium]